MSQPNRPKERQPSKKLGALSGLLPFLFPYKGLIVASGLILYTLGAKHLPSAELTLLSLMEVVGGVIWVWIPLFGINEVPSFTVVLGGIIITSAVLFHGYGATKKREPILP